MPQRKEGVLQTERGNNRSRSAENSLWKMLSTCRKAEYGMKEENIRGRSKRSLEEA
jgi:hypothetical protein